jgi:CRP-like cAMP-binding protein
MIDIDHLTGLLLKVRQFERIPRQEVQDFILAGQVFTAPAGAVLFNEEAPCAGLYVLLQGQVQLCRISSEGQMSIITVFKPVIMFNEVAALDGGANPVTAVALSEVNLWRISAEGLQNFLLQHPNICLELLRVMAQRNRRLVTHFQDLSFRTVQARAAKLLLELSENGQKAVDRRQQPVHLLAARIATVPEAFSRALKALREAGTVQVEPKTIRVIDLAGLSRLAQMEQE